MKVIVIGATGHIGSYLVPRLLNLGYEVVAVTRGQSSGYCEPSVWDKVQRVQIDRQALEAQGTFGPAIAGLVGDIVIDLICFTQASAQHLVEALEGKVSHFLHCGTIWVHGGTKLVPSLESQTRYPICQYGRDKASAESYLLTQANLKTFPVTVIHPGHIVGPRWTSLNPQGNFNPQVFEDIKQGKEIILPNLGKETLHHVHADDVALLFIQAIRHRDKALGQSFHAVSDQALTLNRYVQEVSQHYGFTARIRHISLEAMQNHLSSEDYMATVEHLNHSSNCSNAKAKSLLDYAPKYSSVTAILESLP